MYAVCRNISFRMLNFLSQCELFYPAISPYWTNIVWLSVMWSGKRWKGFTHISEKNCTHSGSCIYCRLYLDIIVFGVLSLTIWFTCDSISTLFRGPRISIYFSGQESFSHHASHIVLSQVCIIFKMHFTSKRVCMLRAKRPIYIKMSFSAITRYKWLTGEAVMHKKDQTCYFHCVFYQCGECISNEITIYPEFFTRWLVAREIVSLLLYRCHFGNACFTLFCQYYIIV